MTAIDLSPRSVDYLRRRAALAGLGGAIETHVSAAERLPLFDESFELALGHRVLACLEPELAAPELHRVLRPGGRALFCEPLRDPALPRLRLGRRGSREAPGPTPDLERWTRHFSSTEVHLVPLPRELDAASGGWRGLPRSWLARIPALRPDRLHRLLLLTR